ncbi:two-component system regulatory protein YycI [Thermovenabulum sp.]|uniref:two-component system regulatory protein YycI n=1 Tax=Thermovenabulum sp. TaxID=3100335 RepID=UPI003C7D6040
MDWKKAITILAVSFFLVNLFMAANLYMRDVINERISGFNTSLEVMNLLKEKGISVKGSLPSKGQDAWWLEVEPRGKIIMEGYSREVEQGFWNMDAGAVRKIAQNFVQEKVGMPSDARFFKQEFDRELKEYRVDFLQEYRDIPIYNSYIKVRIRADGRIIIEKNWLKIEGFKGKKREVVLPVVALLKVAELKGKDKPILVTSIKEGYFSKPVNGEKWQIPPVWRVELDDGEVFYINAFTGEQE